MKSIATVTNFNLDELCTDQQARDLRGFINYYEPLLPAKVGGGVLPGDAFVPLDPTVANTAGIFLPSWTVDSHGDVEPFGVDPVTGAKLYWLSIRFVNGLTSNVGLMRRELFVIDQNAEERLNTMIYLTKYFGA